MHRPRVLDGELLLLSWEPQLLPMTYRTRIAPTTARTVFLELLFFGGLGGGRIG